MGYTIICSKKAGIEASTRYFVPLGENLEIWELTLTNHRDKPAQLSVYSAVEFNLWDAMDDATNFQRNFSIGEVEIVPLALKGRGARVKQMSSSTKRNTVNGATTLPIWLVPNLWPGSIPSAKLSWAHTGVGICLRQWRQADCPVRSRMAGIRLARSRSKLG